MSAEQGPFTGEYPTHQQMIEALASQGLMKFAHLRVRKMQGDETGELCDVLTLYPSERLNAQWPHLFVAIVRATELCNRPPKPDDDMPPWPVRPRRSVD